MYHLYVLRCSDGTFYTGITTELARRLREHNFTNRGAKYTRGRRPVQLVYARCFRNRATALRAEWRLKQLSRQEKRALIRRAVTKSGTLHT